MRRGAAGCGGAPEDDVQAEPFGGGYDLEQVDLLC